jgi:hypothetical protein
VREECKRNRVKVKVGKKAAKFEDKMDGRDRVHDTNGMLERKEKEHGEGKREILPQKRVCQ